ncbi:MAG: ATP-binding cassette domain-containing protein [Candidatus Accumulibacter sp.]|jgi:ATP-binding cassette subfamily F protein 3|nr:ATP-binding cassette domain-containing protein [Accumulibacter sp.]
MIVLKGVTLRRGAKTILNRTTAALNPGEKIGLVGRNGAGKSTFFALLDGSLREDEGDFFRPAHWRIAQVAQEMPETPESAVRFVIAGDYALSAAEAEVKSAEACGDDDRLAHAYMTLHDAGSHDAQARAEALILGLGFRMEDMTRPVNEFSGGWRMRLQLARALMRPSDILLLDEPTNHLDLDALVWLESWLKRYEGMLIVISHDREFLDAVTQVTLHIEDGALTRYGGNYSVFEEIRARRVEEQQHAYLKQQERIAHLQKFIDRFRAKASKARQAQSRVKALERMERLAPALAHAEFSFSFEEPSRMPNPMLMLKSVNCGYSLPENAVAGQSPEIVVRGVSCVVAAGQRIGILGANGQGKSTFVKTVARVLEPLDGVLTAGKGLSVGYFAQRELDVLCLSENPLQHMSRLARDNLPEGKTGREQELRNFLGSFNFSGDQMTQAAGTMSGGEKARLVLCMIVWQRPNLLLLDEPTNHLDLETREALSVALNEFEGAVMLVSHDRALLRAVCDEFWLVSRGVVAPFDGDLDDYQRYLLEEARRARETLKRAREKPPARPEKPSRRPKLLKRELEKIENRLRELQERKQALETRLSLSLTPCEISEVCAEFALTGAALSGCEEEWLAVSESLETEGS